MFRPDFDPETSQTAYSGRGLGGVEPVTFEVVPFRKKNKDVVIIMENGSSRVEHRDVEFKVRSNHERRQMAFEELQRLGYISSVPMKAATHDYHIPPAAIAKFFYQNSMGELVLYPVRVGVEYTIDVICSQVGRDWRSNDEQLIFIHPVQKSRHREMSTATKSGKAGPLPFIIPASRTLVQDVLKRLGYYSSGSRHSAAIHDFWLLNDEYLKPQGVDANELEVTTTTERERVVYGAFTSQRGRQYWRVFSESALLARTEQAKTRI
eukprot:TRINITY_DN38532_c0_g1_i1.p2 TRINITY_DN38532_c0_g1~~TRINITY_DN38532_c0_g1_i1.p2  ORF type:complete len:265 (+),score=21.27 TRINITY_DN38532_c0_g1_i1:760-1554(+)